MKWEKTKIPCVDGGFIFSYTVQTETRASRIYNTKYIKQLTIYTKVALKNPTKDMDCFWKPEGNLYFNKVCEAKNVGEKWLNPQAVYCGEQVVYCAV